MFARSSFDLIWWYFHQIFQRVSADSNLRNNYQKLSQLKIMQTSFKKQIDFISFFICMVFSLGRLVTKNWIRNTKCHFKVFDVVILCKEQRLVKTPFLCRYGLFCMSVMPLCKKILDNFLSWRQISIGRGQTCQSGTVSRFHSALLFTCIKKKFREMKTYFHLTIFFSFSIFCCRGQSYIALQHRDWQEVKKRKIFLCRYHKSQHAPWLFLIHYTKNIVRCTLILFLKLLYLCQWNFAHQ